MRARLGDDTFGSIGMAAVDSRICIRFGQPSAVPKEVVEPPASCALCCTCGSLRASTVFQVEYAYLRVSSTCDDGTVVRVGHELDGEDVGMVASADTGIEGERLRLVVGVVLPDVEVGIVGAGSE